MSKNRIFYFDALRAFAIICVVVLHAYASTKYLVSSDIHIHSLPSINWLIYQFTGNAFRIGVDLFLILSGALSLGRQWSIKSFLSKRLPRIIFPFLFWGFVLGSLFIFLSYFHIFKDIHSFNLLAILKFFYDVFMANKTFTIPFWFFWMILGTYLIMPIFNKWILHSSLDELEYFLVIWLVTCLFDFTINIEFPIKLSYFTSPIGLVVLGYYLRYTERKFLDNKYVILSLIIIPIVLMMVFSILYSTEGHLYNFNRYSILHAFEVMGVFLLFKNFDKLKGRLKIPVSADGIFRKLVFTLAKYSYGIYLVHNTFMVIFSRILRNFSIQPVLYMILLISLSLLLSTILMALFNRIPYINKIIGAK